MRLLLLLLVVALWLPCGALEITFSEGDAVGKVTVPTGVRTPPDGVTAVTPGQPPRVRVSYIARGIDSNVNGNQFRSFTRDGFFNRHDLVVDLQTFEADGHYLTASLGTLYTDDPQLINGGPTVRFPSLFLEFGKQNSYDLRIGNVPVLLSRYTFFQQVDGLRGRLYLPDDLGRWTLEGVASRVHRDRSLVRFNRTAYGARLGREFDFSEGAVRSLKMGVSSSWVSDQSGSLTAAERVNLPAADGQVTSIDMGLFFRNGLSLEGEYGFSSLNAQAPAVQTGFPNGLLGTGERHGQAGRFTVRYTNGPWYAGGEIERTSPNFRSLVGIASSDLLRTNLYATYTFSPAVRLDGSWYTSRNNLDKQLPLTFESGNIRGGLQINPWAESDLAALRPLGFRFGHSTFTSYSGNFSRRRTDEKSAAINYFYGPANLNYTFRDRDTSDPLNLTAERDDDIHSVQVGVRIPFNEGNTIALTPSLGATLSTSTNRMSQLSDTNENLTYGLAADLGRWRLDYSQNVIEGRQFSPFVLGSRDSLNVTRRGSVTYRPSPGDDLSVGIQWNDRRYDDNLPFSNFDSSDFTALIQTRF